MLHLALVACELSRLGVCLLTECLDHHSNQSASASRLFIRASQESEVATFRMQRGLFLKAQMGRPTNATAMSSKTKRRRTMQPEPGFAAQDAERSAILTSEGGGGGAAGGSGNSKASKAAAAAAAQNTTTVAQAAAAAAAAAAATTAANVVADNPPKVGAGKGSNVGGGGEGGAANVVIAMQPKAMPPSTPKLSTKPHANADGFEDGQQVFVEIVGMIGLLNMPVTISTSPSRRGTPMYTVEVRLCFL